jgi:hypothetical protein
MDVVPLNAKQRSLDHGGTTAQPEKRVSLLKETLHGNEE